MDHFRVNSNVVVVTNIYIYYYYDSGHLGWWPTAQVQAGGKRKGLRLGPEAKVVGLGRSGPRRVDIWVMQLYPLVVLGL